MKNHLIEGFTVLELLMVIAIVALLVVVTIPELSKFRSQQALKNTTEDLISLLNQARSDTQASLNSTNYSVYIESNQATYFVGASYASNAVTNKRITYNTAVTVPASGGVNLAGGGSTVTFNRLLGDTGQYGTIVVQLASDATRSRTVTISKTGAISSN